MVTAALMPMAFFAFYNYLENPLIEPYERTSTARDVLLTEAFRSNHFAMAGRGRLWYFSPWDERPWLSRPGHSTWATQYVFERDEAECARRETLLLQFFAPEASDAWRLKLLREEGITLVHSVRSLKLPGLRQIGFAYGGGWLYRFEDGAE